MVVKENSMIGTKRRAAIYARFSSDRQSAYSLDDQVRLCRALAERNGWTVVRVYQDAATSGSVKDRKDYVRMVTDALSGGVDVVLSESLDRLNRDLEETAGLYKRLRFAGVEIVTVSEGPISEVHVSISGLMGEMYLKSLAEKTRRGVEGRVLAGKSGGGRSFGYECDRTSGTGDRVVNEREAEIVREIFRRYSDGQGPRAIARSLNERGVAGPDGRPWGDTTIRGSVKKGSGLLNNELYRGRQVWGRLRYLKDPGTGRRVSRMADAGSMVVTEVPHLRIVDDELWQAVKQQQERVSGSSTGSSTITPLNDLHRPKYLLSGMLTCGVCGGGFTITARERYGCARRTRQGTCSNNRGIQRAELEARVLDGMKSALVTPELVREFISEFQVEWNRIQSNARAEFASRDRRLASVNRKIESMLEAIERGIITASTKERLEALEREKEELMQVKAPPPMPAIHPNLAQVYHDKVARLEKELADPELAADAKSVLRSMIKTIVINPGAERGQVELELHGELASLLTLGQDGNKDQKNRIQVSVVAGAGFEPTTFRL